MITDYGSHVAGAAKRAAMKMCGITISAAWRVGGLWAMKAATAGPARLVVAVGPFNPFRAAVRLKSSGAVSRVSAASAR
ncbi:MAG: hypothetical protein AMJ66_00505 [Betaproteobacteria bacterium SG8_40]|nr:MAG: hypothetical protein AMJ66_00505 [Betaproteobacteria bacterium SG8_40]